MGSYPAAVKSDEIFLDTSNTPWMDVARRELKKNIKESRNNDVFVESIRYQLLVSKAKTDFNASIEKLSTASEREYKLLDRSLSNPALTVLGQMDAKVQKQANSEIDKYFSGLKTDPIYDKKGKSWGIDSTYGDTDGYGRITAWCAAFVNYCLKESGSPYLNYATAKSWLDFGTPVAHPVYGCITVIKPAKSTDSTTGHVAFYVETVGDKVKLLGGNQRDRLSEESYSSKSVVGYRWPTTINQYLLAGPLRSAIA